MEEFIVGHLFLILSIVFCICGILIFQLKKMDEYPRHMLTVGFGYATLICGYVYYLSY